MTIFNEAAFCQEVPLPQVFSSRLTLTLSPAGGEGISGRTFWHSLYKGYKLFQNLQALYLVILSAATNLTFSNRVAEQGQLSVGADLGCPPVIEGAHAGAPLKFQPLSTAIRHQQVEILHYAQDDKKLVLNWLVRAGTRKLSSQIVGRSQQNIHDPYEHQAPDGRPGGILCHLAHVVFGAEPEIDGHRGDEHTENNGLGKTQGQVGPLQGIEE